jgi:uncharacterized protein YaaN involved in tellurite resistance
MNSYIPTPAVIELWCSKYSGASERKISLERLEQFKAAAEHQIQMLTVEVQTINNHINWIQPRLHDFMQFNRWMEQAHPDIINAYKTSTEVAEKLDRANDMAQTQDIPKAAV